MQTVRVLGDYIGGRFHRPRGPERKLVSLDPGDIGYRIGTFPVYPEHPEQAIAAARQACEGWRRLEPDARVDALRKFVAEIVNHRRELARLIAAETGKPLWEAEREVTSVEARVETEIREGVRVVSPFQVAEVRWGVRGRCRFVPLGVVVVLGAAISPLRLPCGHLIPALLAGNAVVYKPSKLVPGCGQLLAHLFDEAGLPPGVFNMVQGDAATGWALAGHPAVDGVLFTGASPAGRRILQATSDHPQKLVALQMGGVNTAVVLPDADLDRAVAGAVAGAFVTAGQRYTSTGVILVESGRLSEFTEAFLERTRGLSIGYAFDAGVFMGPLLADSACERLLDSQQRLSGLGARTLLRSARLKLRRPGHYLSPAVLVFDRPLGLDELRPEGLSFGPDVVLLPFAAEAEGLALANSTAYPNSAAVFTEDTGRFERWAEELRYGQVNHNLPTCESSSRLPLGGRGRSGNHRPGGVLAQRNCTAAVASLEALGPYDPERDLPNLPSRK